MMKKDDANRKNRRKNKNRPKPKAKAINKDMYEISNYFNVPLLDFPEDTKRKFREGIDRIIQRAEEKANKNT